MCDVALEAAGAQETLDVAGRLPRTRGRLVIAGYHQDSPRTVNLQLWNWRGLDVVNAHERDAVVYVEGLREAVRAVVCGAVDPARLYTHSFPLERLGDAAEMALARPDGFVKALVIP
jgi:NADPH2:quinone reductase